MACTVTQHIEKESKANSLEPTLLTALIIVESRFKPWAVSRSNACGLTQVIPKWTGGKASGRVKYTCKQLKNPRTSITAGAKILNWWIKYKGSVRKGLCGYNAGFRGCKSAKNYANAVFKVKKSLEGTANVN
jgi:soluble lytic murein transglycosylase-like protein